MPPVAESASLSKSSACLEAPLQAEYWLYSYLDANGVRTDRDARRLAGSKDFQRAIFEHALSLDYTPTRQDLGPHTVLAGHGIDLSLDEGCLHANCIRARVDDSLARSFHFFDSIAVVGPSAHSIAHLLDEYPEEESRDEEYITEKLTGYLIALLYLRSIGASQLVQFINKPPACRLHYKEHLTEAGLDHLRAGASEIIRTLADAGVLHMYEEHGNHYDFDFEHPWLGGRQSGYVLKQKGILRIRDPKRVVAEMLFREFSADLVSDVKATRNMGVPVTFEVPLSAQLARQAADLPASAAIALSIPQLANIPAGTAIAIRRDEPESFNRFKAALRAAIQERIDGQERDPARIARQIESDYIAPALNDITQRLIKARAVRRSKVEANAVAGIGMLVAGALFQLPLLLPAGLATWSGGVLHHTKYVEEMRDIQLSDMYFLWQVKAMRH